MSITERLIPIAADLFNTTEKDILARRGFKEHSSARNAVCLVANENGVSQYKIAKDLDGRDRTTIRQSLKWARRELDRNPLFAARVKRLNLARKDAA